MKLLQADAGQPFHSIPECLRNRNNPGREPVCIFGLGAVLSSALPSAGRSDSRLPATVGGAVDILDRLADLVPPPRKHRHARPPQPLTVAASQVTTRPRGGWTRRDSTLTVRKTPLLRERRAILMTAFWAGETEATGSTTLTSRAILAEVPLAGLSFTRCRL
jgi:hypothetical protein